MIRRFGLPLVLLLALVLLLPTSLTAAYLTAEQTAQQTQGGTGRWCSVPTPEKQSNVYRLNDIPYVSTSGSQLMVVPVVNNGEFGPAGAARTLGARLWACNSSSLTTSSTVKVTAWRNAGSAASSMQWASRASGGFAGHRLDPRSGFGAEVVRLHRLGSGNVGSPILRGDDRSRYTWLLASDRTRDRTDASAACGFLDPTCSFPRRNMVANGSINIKNAPTLATAFRADSGSERAPNNSVEYLAAGYWSGSGQLATGDPRTVQLDPYAGRSAPFSNGQGPTSNDGRQVQWVVIEWWGDTDPTDDMVVEIFVR